MIIETNNDSEKTFTTTVKGNYVKFKLTPQYYTAVISFSDNLLKAFNGNNFCLQWSQAPTGNCQISSFIEFNNLLNRLLRDYHGYVEHDEAQKLLKCVIAEVFEMCENIAGYSKRQLLLDINAEHLPTVKQLFNTDWFKIEEPYVSTNGSDMVMLLIALKDINLCTYWDVDISKEFIKREIIKEESKVDVRELPF